jgi:hypothetical protein
MSKSTTWQAVAVALASIGTLVASFAATAQLGPTTKYTTFRAVPGKSVEVGNYAAAAQNCTPAPGPAIHVVEAPKSGTLTVRVAQLVYSNVSGCPPIKMPAQVVTYEARDTGVDTDHFIYDLAGAKGEVTIFEVTIEIAPPPKPAPAPSREQKF